MEIVAVQEILQKKNLLKIDDIISNDGILVYPTDTLYGLGGRFNSKQVRKKIDLLKKRLNTPYSVAVSDVIMLENLGLKIPAIFSKIAEIVYPGKFTLLFPVIKSSQNSLDLVCDKLGIRIPDFPQILKLIRAVNYPLISTSVNITGEQPLNDPEAIRKGFPEIDLLIDGGSLPHSRGSTIIDLSNDCLTLIRVGDDLDKLDKLKDYFLNFSQK